MAAAGDSTDSSPAFSGAPDIQSQLTSLRIRIEELERENARLLSQLSSCRCNKDDGNKVYSCLSANDSKSGKKKSRDNKGTFQNIHYSNKRYVALKIMYFGQRFYGFASEAHMDPTVESEIFKALGRTKLLVGNKEEACYSRCGRTDKGVSSTGQVICLYLRSSMKDTSQQSEDDEENSKENSEIDYVKVLNKVLPKDIRVMGWSYVPTNVHARFSCLSREYKYLFWNLNLDILAMQEASKKFLGEHDFRNFCKMDAANVNNYRRQITFFEISSCRKRSVGDELWAITIKGSAFLWHQVRCIVAVLFMIGQGLESPEVVDLLLDTKKTPRKPQFNLAPELPLILRACEFENVGFICSSDARQALHEHLTNELRHFMMQAAIFDEALSCLPAASNCPEFERKKKNHIPLRLRATEPSYEERRARLDLKASHKS